MFGGRIDLVLAGYNGGKNAVIRSGYMVPRCEETRKYVARGISVLRGITNLEIFFSKIMESNHQVNLATVSLTNGQVSRAGSRPSRSIYFRLP